MQVHARAMIGTVAKGDSAECWQDRIDPRR